MKTESHSINDVLAKNATSFFIPPFQRAYAWGKPEIKRYFSDILRIIDSELDPKQHDKLEHFFGTIVIKTESEGLANKSVVVDGQQRLTTTLLFLIALRDIEPDEKNRDYITQNYLTNNASTFEDKIKLKQVTKDWDTYKALVVNKKDANPGSIKDAYQFFSKLINETKETKLQIQFEHYIKAIQRINVAIIFLDERPFKGEDPQIIFETLNSLGKPLTLSDLIRNFVLLNMESKNQSDIYENTWHPKIEAVLKDNTSNFFRDYLQYQKASPIKTVSNTSNTKEVYQQFKDFVRNEFRDNNAFIENIVRYVKLYKWITTEIVTDSISADAVKNREIIELIRNIFHDIESNPFMPFVLGLLEYNQYKVNGIELSDDNLINILKTIRTYLIRRRILGLAKGENKNIISLCKPEYIKKLVTKEKSMVEILSNLFYDMRFPNDKEVEDALKKMNFYNFKSGRFILGKIEEYNAKVAVDFRSSKITIEHIMPQTLTEIWKKDLSDNFENIHKTYIHNIGNLILTEFNGEIGNKSFAEKKVKLNTSSLNFRLDVINKDTWNEASIQEHQKNMITWFLDTFPLPDDYREKNNYTDKKDTESTTFSPLAEEAGDIPKGSKPSELRIDSNSIKVKSWQDVFIKFLQYIKDSQKFDFESILDNQNELFDRGNGTILKWSELKSRIGESADKKNRYKTFDGKTYDEVENLTDDIYFIHVDISASTCMSRIANVMNKLYMSENDVEIVLK